MRVPASYIRSVATAVGCLTVAAVACRDMGVGPQTSPTPPTTPALLLGAGGTSTTTFTVDPKVAGTYAIAGGHKITFPPDAICDPATSGYGPALWDAPCTPTAAKVTITAASWTDLLGRPQVDFSPRLRFNPATTVTLYLYDRRATALSKILFCADGLTGAGCLDESLTDLSLVTHLDLSAHLVSRRIKHFSGYNVCW